MSDPMNPHAFLIAALRRAAERAGGNRSDRALAHTAVYALAADTIESLSARVAELEADELDAASDWGAFDGESPRDTGVPHVTTLDPTPLAQIEARLAALEAVQAPPAPLGVETDDAAAYRAAEQAEEAAQDRLLNMADTVMREEGLHWDRNRGLIFEKARARIAAEDAKALEAIEVGGLSTHTVG